MDVNQVRAYYLIAHDTPLNATNEKDLRAEIEHKQRFVRIPSYDDALADPRLTERDKLAMSEAREFLSLPAVRMHASPTAPQSLQSSPRSPSPARSFSVPPKKSGASSNEQVQALGDGTKRNATRTSSRRATSRTKRSGAEAAQKKKRRSSTPSAMRGKSRPRQPGSVRANGGATGRAAAKADRSSAEGENGLREMRSTNTEDLYSPRVEPNMTRVGFRYDVKRPLWLPQARGPIVPDGNVITMRSYGSVLIGSAYSAITVDRMRPGDMLLTLSAREFDLGGVVFLPAVDDRDLVEHAMIEPNQRGLPKRSFAQIDAKIARRLDAEKCPYCVELYLILNSLDRLDVPSECVSASLWMFADAKRDDPLEGRCSLIQQVLGAAMGFRLNLTDVRAFSVPEDSARVVFSRTDDALGIYGRKAGSTGAAARLPLQALWDHILGFKHAVGYRAGISSHELIIRRQLVPLALGLWSSQPAEFGKRLGDVAVSLHANKGKARLKALNGIYRSWRALVPSIRTR